MVIENNVFSLFGSLGDSISQVYSNESAVYFILFISIFWIMFVLINFGLQKVNHLRGKPAKVISIMSTFIGVSLLFFSKTQAEMIAYLSNLLGLIFAIIGSVIIIMSANYWSKKFKDNIIRTFILTASIWLCSSFLVPLMIEFSKVASSSSSENFLGIVLGLLMFARDITSLVAVITGIMLFFRIFKFNKKNDSPEKKNRNAMKRNLSEILKETKNAQEVINQMTDNLTKLEKLNLNSSGGIN